MGYRASRPIVVVITDTTPVYVPLARERSRVTVSAGQISGLTAVAVDYTLDNIARGPSSSYDVNNEEHVAPGSANWEAFQPAANLVANPLQGVTVQALGLRITGTGTGSARVVIQQEG